MDYIISEIITNRVWYHNVVKYGAVFGEWSHSASGPHWAHSRYKATANDCTSYIYWWEVWHMLMLFFVQHVSFTQPYQHVTCACTDPSADFLRCSDHYCPLLSNPAIFVSTPAHTCRHINDTLHDDAHWMWHFYRTAAEQIKATSAKSLSFESLVSKLRLQTNPSGSASHCCGQFLWIITCIHYCSFFKTARVYLS